VRGQFSGILGPEGWPSWMFLTLFAFGTDTFGAKLFIVLCLIPHFSADGVFGVKSNCPCKGLSGVFRFLGMLSVISGFTFFSFWLFFVKFLPLFPFMVFLCGREFYQKSLAASFMVFLAFVSYRCFLCVLCLSWCFSR